ncbi:protein disulfide isomerase fusion protein [Ectocarpus siliculosus]|uniref:Protein disulfide isomerase fusion protein n=1 Tax=Ectocarpus siliculosus TaxID=2880 RepID=D7G2R2_ECTSI|nr:protein disulfide isomerase fusion protein [Ectocarpus siliculosus]|eukprot:CBJ26887.1 protein disulfide isomerase fusion protein [Ectocarpus siliculosus]
MAMDRQARRCMSGVVILLAAMQAGGFFCSMGPAPPAVGGGGAAPSAAGGPPRSSCGGPARAAVVSMPHLGQENTRKAPSAVRSLTLETFDAVAMDPSKHTLVEFFAPWCTPCKKLEPVYEELGRRFETESNVVVAKVDATGEQDLKKRFDITGFPRLKFFPAGGGVEPYSGTRDLESMEEFLKEKVRGLGDWVASSAPKVSPPSAAQRSPPPTVSSKPAPSPYQEYMAARKKHTAQVEAPPAQWVHRTVVPAEEKAAPSPSVRGETGSLYESYMASRIAKENAAKAVESVRLTTGEHGLSECLASGEPDPPIECAAPPAAAAKSGPVASGGLLRKVGFAARASVRRVAGLGRPASSSSSSGSSSVTPNGGSAGQASCGDVSPYEQYMRSRGQSMECGAPEEEEKEQTSRVGGLMTTLRRAGSAFSRLLSPVLNFFLRRDRSKEASCEPGCPDVPDECRAKKEAAIQKPTAPQAAAPQGRQQECLSPYESYMASRKRHAG